MRANSGSLLFASSTVFISVFLLPTDFCELFEVGGILEVSQCLGQYW